MHHFYVAPAGVRDGCVELEEADAHHAVRVLRIRPGETISVADGTGRILEAVVMEVGAHVRAEIRTTRTVEAARPALVLYQAVAKGDRIDEMVEKAVELGVATIVPFVAERTIVRWDEAKREKARERWCAIARAAAMQCRSPRLTTVAAVVEGVEGICNEDSTTLVLHEGATSRLHDVLPKPAPDALVLVVGPEGGLTLSELQTLEGAGARLATLGDRILRTETAGVAAAAIIGYAYGNLG
jgi:16S rRNA (uracil1498-N3)-methyltransferase